MYDLSITAEQTEIQETIRDFVRREIAPAVLNPEHLEDLSCPLLLDIVERASGLGLRTLTLPENQGGAGAGVLTSCIAMEELGAGDAGIAATLAQTALLGRALFAGALNDEQRARFLPPFQSDDRYHLAHVADTDDPDRDLAYHRDGASVSPNGVRAVRQPNGDWILNGTSRFGDNIPLAKLIVMEVAVDANSADGGKRCALLVTPQMRGVNVEIQQVLMRDSDTFVRRWTHATSGRIIFSECRVPAANVIQTLDEDLANAGRAAWTSPLFPAINLGIGRCALDAAIDYTKLRVQGGRRIVEHQAIGGILADCAIKLEAARNMVWKAAWALDHPELSASVGMSGSNLHQMAKVFTSEAVHDVSLQAAECFGAMGIMLDMPLAKYVRDARIFLHCGRSNPVGRFRIAEMLAGFSAG
jgi:alkylation response protein AidB-like acyl-CoA dehydrogenase